MLCSGCSLTFPFPRDAIDASSNPPQEPRSRYGSTHCINFPEASRRQMSVRGGKPLVKFLALKDFCILRQLKLEEALLRGTSSNWCVVTDGAASPTVVMGLSG